MSKDDDVKPETLDYLYDEGRPEARKKFEDRLQKDWSLRLETKEFRDTLDECRGAVAGRGETLPETIAARIREAAHAEARRLRERHDAHASRPAWLSWVMRVTVVHPAFAYAASLALVATLSFWVGHERAQIDWRQVASSDAVRTSRPQEVTLPSSATLAKLESAPVKPPAARVNEAPQSAPPPIQEAEDVSRPIASKTVALKADAARPALSLAEQLSEARSLHARRDWQTALVHYEQIAQSAPGTYEGLLAQHKTAQIYARAGRHEEAFDRYQRILKENPRYRHIDRVLLEGGKVGIALRQWDKAKGMLETCYNRYPSLRRDVAPYLEVAKQFAALPIVDAEVDGDALQP